MDPSGSCDHITLSEFAQQAKHVQAGRAESCLALQLAIPAPSTSQSRPTPGRASSQPLLDEHEASGYSVSFYIQVDELPDRPFLLLTRNSSSRKFSLFAQNHQPRLDG